MSIVIQTIQIKMPEGFNGIHISECPQYPLKAIEIPRNKLEQFYQYVENSKDLKGVYLRINTKDRIVYVGQSTDLVRRINHHNNNLDEKIGDWDIAIVVFSKDNSLDRSHIGYLERKLIESLKASSRYSLSNETKGNQEFLTESQESDYGAFLVMIQTLVGALGYRLFEERKKESSSPKHSTEQNASTFYFRTMNVDATAIYYPNPNRKDKGRLILLKDSTFVYPTEKQQTAISRKKAIADVDDFISKGLVSLDKATRSCTVLDNIEFSSVSAAERLLTVNWAGKALDKFKNEQGTLRDYINSLENN